MNRPFNALNGRELANAIAIEVARAMDNNEQFRTHLTFPIVEWNWTLTVKAYPIEAQEIVVQAGGRGANEEELKKVLDEAVLRADKNPAVLIIEGEQERTDTPDLIRDKAGLEKTAPQRISGVTVEAPIQKGGKR
jgi:thermostable 8-oxoguanine DNA glycosylase